MPLAQKPAVGSPSRVAFAGDPTIIGDVVLNPDGTIVGGGGGGGGDVSIVSPFGQALMAVSIPVVLASDQTAIPYNLTQVGGATFALGQTTMAASLPIALASDQTPVPTNLTQVGGSAITLGIQTSSTCFPVVIAQDQGAITVSQSSDAWLVQGRKLASTANTANRFINIGANSTLNVKSSTGNIFSLYCNNANAASRYIQIHNTATVPAGGAAPVLSFLIPPTSQIIVGTDFFTNEGLNLSTGIAFAFSTTRDTYTAGSASDQQTSVNYV